MAVAAATVPSADSPTLGRPRMTVTGPAASSPAAVASASGSMPPTSRSPPPASSAATTSPAVPGRCSSEAPASSDTAVRCGASSTTQTPSFDDGVAQPEEQDRQLLLEVGRQHEDGAALGEGLVDGGPRQAEHGLGGQAVAELGVDVVGADDALGQLGPGVGVLVGEPGAAEHGHPLGRGVADGGGGLRQRLAPRRPR